MVSESRIDVISTSQLVIEGCAPLYRFDRTTIGGGTLGFEITCLPIFYIFPDFSNTECLVTEINSSKLKWFMTCSHNRDKIKNLQCMMNLSNTVEKMFYFQFSISMRL